MKRIWALTAILLVLACSGAKVKKTPTAEDLYNNANKELQGKKLIGIIPVKDYQAAIDDFKKVVDSFPYSQWAILAELRIADATFLKGDYLEAVSLYKEFQKKHPTNDRIPYVFYQIGLSYLQYQDDLSIFRKVPYDRDLTAVENGIVEFESLISGYPSSQYTEQAREKLKICREAVAKHETYVGDFYYSRGGYQSALMRYKRVTEDFADLPQAERALYRLCRCYIAINEPEYARASLTRLIEFFPQGAYTSEARGLLDSLSREAKKR